MGRGGKVSIHSSPHVGGTHHLSHPAGHAAAPVHGMVVARDVGLHHDAHASRRHLRDEGAAVTTVHTLPRSDGAKLVTVIARRTGRYRSTDDPTVAPASDGSDGSSSSSGGLMPGAAIAGGIVFSIGLIAILTLIFYWRRRGAFGYHSAHQNV